MTFSEAQYNYTKVTGHRAILTNLDALVDLDTVPGALLLCGTRGIGKRRVAQYLAERILSVGTEDDPHTSTSAEVLPLIRSGNHPDLHVLTPSGASVEIKVDDIRQLCAQLSLRPYTGRYSVSILDDADGLTSSAANALLKTLEEPSMRAKIILVSSAYHRLPETIISRSQQIHFGELSTSDIKSIVGDIASALDVEEEVTYELLPMLEGSVNQLCLGEFIDPRKLTIDNNKACLSHLRSLSSRYRELTSQLRELFPQAGRSLPEAHYPIALASELATKNRNDPLVWHALRHSLDKYIHTCPLATMDIWGDILLQVLEAERMVTERFFNSNLQLSSLLLSIYKASLISAKQASA